MINIYRANTCPGRPVSNTLWGRGCTLKLNQLIPLRTTKGLPALDGGSLVLGQVSEGQAHVYGGVCTGEECPEGGREGLLQCDGRKGVMDRGMFGGGGMARDGGGQVWERLRRCEEEQGEWRGVGVRGGRHRCP